MRPEFNEELQCTPIRLGYDFARHLGTLNLMRGERCDIAGCIALFERIDPKLERINIFSGANRMGHYVRVAGEWCAEDQGQT